MKSANKTVHKDAIAEKRRRKKFFELANRFRNSTDPKEANRFGDELGRIVFGD